MSWASCIETRRNERRKKEERTNRTILISQSFLFFQPKNQINNTMASEARQAHATRSSLAVPRLLACFGMCWTEPAGAGGLDKEASPRPVWHRISPATARQAAPRLPRGRASQAKGPLPMIMHGRGAEALRARLRISRGKDRAEGVGHVHGAVVR